MSLNVSSDSTASAVSRLALWPSHAHVPEAMELTGLSRSALYRAAGDGNIRMVKLGRSSLVDMRSVLTFLDALPLASIKPAPQRTA